MARMACKRCSGRGSVYRDPTLGNWGLQGVCPDCDGSGCVGPRIDFTTPCPHPGRYHLDTDGLAILQPHPSATTCFAREQGHVVVRIEPAYLHLGPALVAALNANAEAERALADSLGTTPCAL